MLHVGLICFKPSNYLLASCIIDMVWKCSKQIKNILCTFFCLLGCQACGIALAMGFVQLWWDKLIYVSWLGIKKGQIYICVVVWAKDNYSLSSMKASDNKQWLKEPNNEELYWGSGWECKIGQNNFVKSEIIFGWVVSMFHKSNISIFVNTQCLWLHNLKCKKNLVTVLLLQFFILLSAALQVLLDIRGY